MSSLWNRIAGFVIKHHKGIVMATIILAALSLISAGNIQIKTKMKDMLPEDNLQVQMMDEVDRHFSGGTSLFITIEGDDKEEMVACAEALVEEVEARAELREYIRTINLKLDKEFVTKWGFLLQEVDDLSDSKELFAQVNLLPFLTAVNDSFEETYIDNSEDELSTSRQENEAAAMLGGLETFFTLLRDYLTNPEAAPLPEQRARLAATFILLDSCRFRSNDTVLLLILVPYFAINDVAILVKFIDGIKKISAQVKREYAQLAIVYSCNVPIQAHQQ